jgi:hypothetical protein
MSLADIPTRELVELADELREAAKLAETWRFVGALLGVGAWGAYADSIRATHTEERARAERNWPRRSAAVRALAPTHGDVAAAYEAVLVELERRGAP